MRSTVLNIRINRRQSGQAIVLIALLILVLFGMLGLAVDSGRGYVDRRDQQTAVDASALAAGDWYENYPDYNDLVNLVIPKSINVYMANLRIYSGVATSNHLAGVTGVPPNNNLPQDTWHETFAGGYVLDIVATNTQFNGYQFVFTTTHDLPLAFIQIFGGSPTISVGATATSIVGNQRQTPALLTLSTGACATEMSGSGQLTILGDAYSNGTACVDSDLHLAGNCYGASGSTCSTAEYYCFNGSAGFVPYPPPCKGSDVLGNAVVPAPTLPDPGYLTPSLGYYNGAGQVYNRGNWFEMTPGSYTNWSISSNGCYFLDAGIYTWNGGYASHGALLTNELKAPQEEQWNAPGTTQQANGNPNAFWQTMGCVGSFTVSAVPAPGFGIKHQGGAGNWGIELTSVRHDRFLDTSFGATNPCSGLAGCRRESTPSSCEEVGTIDGNNQGINVTINANVPGAQYYNVYLNPNGCDGNVNNFSFIGRYLAPGWVDAGGPPASSPGTGPWTGTLINGVNGWPCGIPTITICGLAYNNLTPTNLCYAQTRSKLCQSPDDEAAPQCFANCPPPNAVPADNPAMSLEYPPYTGGDVANENYCVISPNPGDPNQPCTTARVTPGAVQFYIPAGGCLDQNGNGYTHVFSGEQYNWIVIYEPASNTCPITSQHMNGSALTQYIGTIYSPAASWDILGSDTSPLAGQVICYSAKVTGSGSAGIDFNPNYSPAPPAARLIN
ncbi:MAG TPA: Tad domain-containing protein [Candidatus Dormibacteraeota bacterium]|nr:Tad domain-containing protein [Candidatus Dormibacteraeota bacterium]